MPLKIAVPNKGRLCDDVLELLRAIGIRISPHLDRSLVHNAPHGKIQILFARAQDIPEFVELGASDLGISGLDLIAESGSDVEKLVDLTFGKCKLIVAAPEGSRINGVDDVPAGARVATAFPNLTERYFQSKKRKVTVIPVHGATEITPYIGVADLITDLTETGSTLKKNHLTLVDVILDSWAVLFANKKVLTKRKAEIEEVTGAIRSVMDAAAKRYLMVNIPRTSLDEATRLLPGVSGPTVMNLAGDKMAAVHAVVGEEHINALIPKLRKLGATGILVLPIERMV